MDTKVRRPDVISRDVFVCFLQLKSGDVGLLVVRAYDNILDDRDSFIVQTDSVMFPNLSEFMKTLLICLRRTS